MAYIGINQQHATRDDDYRVSITHGMVINTNTEGHKRQLASVAYHNNRERDRDREWNRERIDRERYADVSYVDDPRSSGRCYREAYDESYYCSHRHAPETYNESWNVKSGASLHAPTRVSFTEKNERAIVLVNVNGDSKVVRPTPPTTIASASTNNSSDRNDRLLCCYEINRSTTNDNSRWSLWCRPTVFLLVLALLVLIFVLISGILLYCHYVSLENRRITILGDPVYKPKKTYKEEPCVKTFCAWGATCVNQQDGRALCMCPTDCPPLKAPVCGSDHRTYTNHCQMRVSSCQRKRNIRVLHQGECELIDPCKGVQCGFGARCLPSPDGKNSTCQCPERCVNFDDYSRSGSVCGSDGRDYDDECKLKQAGCATSINITVRFYGKCDPCAEVDCPELEICQLNESREPVCRCDDACPLESTSVCGSDGKTYSSECSLRQESCRTRHPLEIIHKGNCSSDTCEDEKCEFYASCGSEGQCVCPQNCEDENMQGHAASVCGSNNITYSSGCHLRIASCKLKQYIHVAYKGNCDLCQEVQCKYGAKCEGGECICPTNCEDSGTEPVCSSTMITYPNECELQKASCLLPPEAEPLSVKYYGECYERTSVTINITTLSPDTSHPEGVYSVSPPEIDVVTNVVSVPEREACRDIHCDYEATCELGSDNFPRCTCHFDCSSPAVAANSKPVCASDLQLYPSLCAMKMEACQRQEDLRLRPLDLCQGLKIKPCNGDQPLTDPKTLKELDCGNGPMRQDCPPGSYCHQTNQFAKCCRKDSFHQPNSEAHDTELHAEETTSVEESCENSWFGCCSDGKTTAKGENHAGCPSTCGCNKLGSYPDFCDPITQQCRCRPGVGGLKCDRCEPGYWGLPKISFGHQGCIPCGCSMFGSVREDCEQMTGRCVCKPEIQGQKCTVCKALDKSLGPNGCILVNTSISPPTSCKDLSCYFGAICTEKDGSAICECNLECINEPNMQKVCGSDGQTYSSECIIRMVACRTQKDIVVQAFGACKENLYGGTDWSQHRYTPKYFTQPDEFNPPLSKSTRHLLSPDSRFYYERGSTVVRSQPLDRYKEYSKIASPEMNQAPNLLYTKGESNRPTPATVNVITALLGDLCSVQSDCTIMHSTCKGGACVCLPEYNESPNRRECIIYSLSNTSASIPYKACSSSPCFLGSTCLELPTNTFSCLCNSNKTGPLCETNIIQRNYQTPSFNGNSYIRLHTFTAYHKLSVEIEFKSYSNDGLLFYNQQKSDGSGDFVSLAIIKGFVEFRYDLGDGIVAIRSLERIRLKFLHKVVIKRYHRDGMLKLDDGEDVIGQSRGNLRALDLDQDVFVGSIPTNTSRVFTNAGTNQGFIGCMKKFKIDRRTIDLHENFHDLVIQTVGIEECSTDPCLEMPCQNGGSCHVVNKGLFTCTCSPPYIGSSCERINDNILDSYIPQFNGTSFLQLPQLQNAEKALTIDIWFMTKLKNGLIFYNGQMKNGQGDFISLVLSNGHVQFRYNLGSGIANITSKDTVTLGKWHWAKVHRNERHGSLEFDNSTPISGYSGPSLTELNLEMPFFIGSIPSWTEIHRLSGASKGFKGSIQKIALNGKPFPITHKLRNCTARTLNNEMCAQGIEIYDGAPCPKLNNPCLNNGICIPQLNNYNCQCPRSHKGHNCEKIFKENGLSVKFSGKSFILYSTGVAKNSSNTYGKYYMTSSDVGKNFTLVEDPIEFIDSSYVDIKDENDTNTFKRNDRRSMEYEIMLRTTSSNGLLLWQSNDNTFKSEYLSVAIVDGYPELSYDLGKQESFWAVTSPLLVNDGKWHTLHVKKRKTVGSISVDNSLPVRGSSYPGSTIWGANNLWIGGSPNLSIGFPVAYYKGFQGCIKYIYINAKSLSLTQIENNSMVHYCIDDV